MRGFASRCSPFRSDSDPMIHVRYFASLRERMGRAGDRVPADAGCARWRMSGPSSPVAGISRQRPDRGQHGMRNVDARGARGRRNCILSPVTGADLSAVRLRAARLCGERFSFPIPSVSTSSARHSSSRSADFHPSGRGDAEKVRQPLGGASAAGHRPGIRFGHYGRREWPIPEPVTPLYALGGCTDDRCRFRAVHFRQFHRQSFGFAQVRPRCLPVYRSCP